jgi:hypothetical protein
MNGRNREWHFRSLDFARDEGDGDRDDVTGDCNWVQNGGDSIPGFLCSSPMGLFMFPLGLRSPDTPELWETTLAPFLGQLSGGTVDVSTDHEHRDLDGNDSLRRSLTCRIDSLMTLTWLVWFGIMVVPGWAVWLASLVWLARAGGSGWQEGDHG